MGPAVKTLFGRGAVLVVGWAGVGRLGTAVGAPSVSWVRDDRGVVGDNNLDWVTPGWGPRSPRCLEAVEHWCWRAWTWQELTAETVMFNTGGPGRRCRLVRR